MKKYDKPQLKIMLLSTVDVIATSGETGEEEVKARYLKTTVNNNEGISYGAQSVSIYD